MKKGGKVSSIADLPVSNGRRKSESGKIGRKRERKNNMFGLISKKKLIEVAVDAFLMAETSKETPQSEFFYRIGGANAINYICYKLGIDITKEVRRAKERSEGK